MKRMADFRREGKLSASMLYQLDRRRVRTVGMFFVLAVTVFGLNATPMASALSNNQLNVLNSGVPFFNTEICGDNTGSAPLVGGDYIQKAFNYFVSKNLTPEQSAGIVGNLMQESGVDPTAVQANGPGRGIAQWSVGQRWDGPPPDSLKAFVAGGNMLDLSNQLNFMWYELTGPYTNALTALKATVNAKDAAISFSNNYEAPGDPQMQNRIRFALQVLQQYGNGIGADSSQSCGVQCNNSADTTSANLSPVRQQIVCLAQQELAAWTPPPSIPRMGYLKYSDGQQCDIGLDPSQPNGCIDGKTQEWCADFASWIYLQAGVRFSGGDSGGWRLVNIFQIEDAGKTDPHFHWHDAKGYTPQPGDLAIHSNPPTKFGHVNIVINVSGNTVNAIGGDQGDGPYGGPKSQSVVSRDQWTGSTGEYTIGYTSPE